MTEAPVKTDRNLAQARGDNYKWVVLTNTTIGVLMSTIDASIMLIALPNVFRGIGLDPLKSSNTFYLLWMILGFLLVTSVLVVSFGRLGDMYGRIRMYNLGFAIFTFFSLLLSLTWMSGQAAGIWIVSLRIFQGVGAALLVANAAAILTDAFPEHQRGMALGINQASIAGGTFIGLVLGGVLGPINWRLIFLVTVPIGLFGTLWAYFKLKDDGVRRPTAIDWPGNITFALGMIFLLIGVTYGIQPYRGHTMGWSSPWVLLELILGLAFLAAFSFIEVHVPEPMFRLPLFRIRAFTSGVVASFLSGLARGGLLFIMIIWLQGIWLPEHGYDFARTPFWAGIYMLPIALGILIAGPISGLLSDRYGSRPFATGGMLGLALAFFLFDLLPIDFNYLPFGLLLFFSGLMLGLYTSPNRAGVMNSLPRQHRGAGSGMNVTFQNSAQVFSIGIFFSVMIIGLASGLPASLYTGLVRQGVLPSAALRASHIPPVSTLFAAFLGYSPLQHTLGRAVLSQLPTRRASFIAGRQFFPSLVSSPFAVGLHAAFLFAMVACLIAAAASWTRGGQFVFVETESVPADPGRGRSLGAVPKTRSDVSCGVNKRCKP